MFTAAGAECNPAMRSATCHRFSTMIGSLQSPSRKVTSHWLDAPVAFKNSSMQRQRGWSAHWSVVKYDAASTDQGLVDFSRRCLGTFIIRNRLICLEGYLQDERRR
uniref:Uncharacterized protein n=1 Tax=Bionectria ochroleuca TaxID=29856 RepID=A0A8H7K8I6_BIOOC